MHQNALHYHLDTLITAHLHMLSTGINTFDATEHYLSILLMFGFFKVVIYMPCCVHRQRYRYWRSSATMQETAG